jgi:hypothetical protein
VWLYHKIDNKLIIIIIIIIIVIITITKGVSHCGLAIYILKYLKEKEEGL